MANQNSRDLDPKNVLIESLTDPADIDDMTEEELDQFFLEEGIDLGSHIQAMHDRMAEVRGQERLDQAGRERQSQFPSLATPPDPRRGPVPAQNWAAGAHQRSLDGPEDLDAEIHRRLASLSPSQASRREAYFRKLETASDNDKREMLKDLDTLETFARSREQNERDEP